MLPKLARALPAPQLPQRKRSPSRIHRVHSGLVARLAVFSLFAVAAIPAAAAENMRTTRAQVAEHRADLKELRGRIGQIKKEIAGSEATRAEAADQLQASERAISQLQHELRELAVDRAELLATRDRLRAEADQLAGRLDDQHEGLGSALVIYHRLSLRSNGGTDAERALQRRALTALADARAGQIALTAESLDRKARHAQATEQQAVALAKVEARQREQQAALVAQRAARQQLLRKISARLDTQRRQVDTLQQDERRLSRLVDRLSRVLAARPKARKPRVAEPSPPTARPTPGIALGPGKLPFQVGHPVGGAAGKRTAKGLFFAVPAGHEIRAVAGGEVVFSDWLRGFGNLLIIDHGDDFLSIYGYNDALLRQVGDRVGRGDVVANAGDTGGRGETGLYFEMRHEGAAIDAGRWLARR